MNEFDLIARHFAPLAADEPGAFGLLDDAATFAVEAGLDLVVTTDMIVADVHFLADDPPATVGAKLLGVNLSDLAAMGAKPRAYTLSTALPKSWSEANREAWLDGFAGGLKCMQGTFSVTLIGGDTVATLGPLTLNATAFGTVPAERPLRRSGARPGDAVFLTGTLGDAALGLRVLRGTISGLSAADADQLVDRYRRPRPRVALGMSLLGVATATVDVSDGLVADLGHVAAASGVDIEIPVAEIPLSEPARRIVEAEQKWRVTVLGGGDDYELAFTAPLTMQERLRGMAAEAGVPITRIGWVRSPAGQQSGVVRLLDRAGRTLPMAGIGYRHF